MPDRSADLILTNGRIYTLDRKRAWATSVAVKGGRIVAVGEADAVAGLDRRRASSISAAPC